MIQQREKHKLDLAQTVKIISWFSLLVGFLIAFGRNVLPFLVLKHEENVSDFYM